MCKNLVIKWKRFWTNLFQTTQPQVYPSTRVDGQMILDVRWEDEIIQ